MTRWRALARWGAAMGAVAVVLVVLWVVLAGQLGGNSATLGPTERRINLVADLGDDGADSCDPELRKGDPAPVAPLRPTSTACVVVGVKDSRGDLRWFFTGHGTGDGRVQVPKPTRSGVREVLLENGAVVPIGATVQVRCTPDPNERFETWVAAGLATQGYLDAYGFLVAIDCEPPTPD